MVRNENHLGKSYLTFENLVYSDGTISLQVAPDSVDKVLLTGTLVAADVSNKGVVKIELVGEDLSYFESDYRLLMGMGTASSRRRSVFEAGCHSRAWGSCGNLWCACAGLRLAPQKKVERRFAA